MGLSLALRVEADLTDVAGDDRSFLFYERDAKCVVNDGFLHGVHRAEVVEKPHGGRWRG